MPDEATDPEAVVDAQVSAYNDGDVDAFLDCYADDAVVTTLADGEVVVEGRDGLRDHYGALFAENPDLACEVTDRLVHGAFVVDREAVSGLAGEEVTAIAVYRVENGLIRRVWLAQ